MKSILSLLLATLTAAIAFAADDHEHSPAAGPNGGRVIEIEGGHAEFFVQPDRKARITILDANNKAVAPGAQIITAIAEAPAGRTKLDFAKTPEAFVSEASLPEGDGYRIVIQVRASGSSRPQNTRIDFQTAICGGCTHPEYACTCSGH